ncbi:MAG: restriction endonuclease subunit S [Betaproteobacteria bacterium]
MALTVSVDEIIRGSRNPLLGARPHWKRIRLGDIASALNGFAFKSAQFTKGHGMPLIRIRDVGGDSTDTNYVGEFDDRYVVKSGDLLVGMDGDFNCARWRGPLGLLNQRVCKVTLQSDQYHPRFLDFSLPGYLKAINDATSSVTVKHLSSRTIEDIPLPFPSLHEQEEIVAELEKQFSRLDEAVANLKRVKANLKRQRSSVLQAVTSGRLAAEGSVPCQEKWRWLTIEELASAAPRSIQSGPFGSNLKHSEFQLSGKLVIGIDNVRDGEFSIGSNHRISEAKFKELEKYAARPGDVLITVMATIGRVCVVPDDIEPAIITKHVYRITVNRDLAIPAYVGIALRGSGEVREQLMDLVQGQTRPGLNGGLIKKIRLPIPPLAYQWSVVAEVDRRLSIVREVEAEVDANLKRAQALRQAVLAQAFLSDSLGTRREAAARI